MFRCRPAQQSHLVRGSSRFFQVQHTGVRIIQVLFLASIPQLVVDDVATILGTQVA